MRFVYDIVLQLLVCKRFVCILSEILFTLKNIIAVFFIFSIYSIDLLLKLDLRNWM